MKINEESPNQPGSEREYSSSEKFKAAMSRIKKEMNGQDNRRMLLINKLLYGGFLASNYLTTVKNIRGKRLRQLMIRARSVLVRTINETIELLRLVEPDTDLTDVTFLRIALAQIHSQCESLIKTLRIALPKEHQLALDLEPIKQKLLGSEPLDQFEQEQAEGLIKLLKQEYGQNELYFARLLATQTIVEDCAHVVGVELFKNGEKITRSIIFPPEFKQAGISILSYFSRVLTVKYPDINVGVTIEQSGDKVTLIIDTPEGQQERIEGELDRYGLVVAGRLSVEQYFSDPKEALALKHKLELAEVELRHTRELLHAERAQFESRLKQLEDFKTHLSTMLSKKEDMVAELVGLLTELENKAGENSKDLLQGLIRIVERGIGENDHDEIIRRLDALKKADSSVFRRLYEILVVGAVQGAAGNQLFQTLQMLAMRLGV
jgi:hypothetical protein